jgi:type III pantothenate kinase
VGDPPDPLLIDLGNTALKAALRPPGGPPQMQRLALSGWSAWDPRAFAPSAHTAWLASSNPELAPKLQARLERAGYRVVSVGRDYAIPLASAYEPKQALGVDRMLAAWAAFARVRNRVGVVSAGTALTWDLVDAEGVFRGGVIAPGLGLLSRGLALAAPHLPFEEGDGPDPEYPARTSLDCVTLGRRLAERGMVQELLRRFDLATGGGVPLFVTGGDAPRVLQHLPPDRATPAADLVLDGLAQLATDRVGAP